MTTKKKNSKRKKPTVALGDWWAEALRRISIETGVSQKSLAEDALDKALGGKARRLMRDAAGMIA